MARSLKMKDFGIPQSFRTDLSTRECLEDVATLSGRGIADTINDSMRYYFSRQFPSVAAKHGLDKQA